MTLDDVVKSLENANKKKKNVINKTNNINYNDVKNAFNTYSNQTGKYISTDNRSALQKGMDEVKKNFNLEDGYQFGDITKGVLYTTPKRSLDTIGKEVPIVNTTRKTLKNFGKNLFQVPENWKDGYQFGDIAKTIGGSTADAGLNIYGSVSQMVEGLAQKLPGQAWALIEDAKGNTEKAKKIREYLKDEKNYLSTDVKNFREKYFEPYSIYGSSSDQVASGIGSTIGSAGLSMLPGGSVNIGKLKDVPIAMGIAEMGNSVNENYSKEDITNAQAWLNGAGKGVVSALSESIFGAFGVGGSELDDALVKGVTKNLDSQLAKGLAQLGIKAGGEACEEFLEYAGDYIVNYATDMISAGKGAQFAEEWNNEEVLQSMISAFLSTSLTQGGSTIQNIARGTDVITGNTKATQEQIDQEVNTQKQALEQEGKKVGIPKLLELEQQATEKVYLQQGKASTSIKVVENENLTDNEKDMFLNMVESSKNLNELNGINRLMNLDYKDKTGNVTQEQVQKITENYLASAKANNIDVNNVTVQSMLEIATARGFEITYDKNAFNNSNEGAKWTVDDNGNRKVFINPNVNNETSLQNLTVHELTHDLENTEDYKVLSDLVLDFAEKRGFKNSEAETDLRELYKNELAKYDTKEKQNAFINSELVANILGTQLGNQEFINHLTISNRQTANKLYNWVVDKLNKLNRLTGYKFEKLYWADVKNKFDKAFKADFNNYKGESKNAIIKVANFDEEVYNNIDYIMLPSKVYGKLIHTIDSDLTVQPGMNIIELFNEDENKYYRYTFYYKDIKSKVKVVSVEEADTDYEGEIANEYNEASSSNSERNEGSRSREKNNKWDNGLANNRTLAKTNDGLLERNKKSRNIRKSTNNESITNNAQIKNEELAQTSSFSLPNNIDYKDNLNHVSDIFREDYSIFKNKNQPENFNKRFSDFASKHHTDFDDFNNIAVEDAKNKGLLTRDYLNIDNNLVKLTTERQGNDLWILELYVENQRQGAGTKVVKVLQEYAEKAGLTLKTDRELPGAKGFWDKVLNRNDTDEKYSKKSTGAFNEWLEKNTSNKETKVPIKKQTTETKGTLQAVHNLSAEKLQGLLDLGGIPVPSIAITNQPHTQFGDISLIFDKSTIDPSNYKNEVYDRDVWSPTFPQVDYVINDKEIENVSKNIGIEWWKLNDYAEDSNSPEYLVEKLLRNEDVIDKYIKDNNLDYKTEYKDSSFKRSYNNTEEMKEWVNKNKITLEKLSQDEKLVKKYLELTGLDKDSELYKTLENSLYWYNKDHIMNPWLKSLNNDLKILTGESEASPEIDEYKTRDNKKEVAKNNGIENYLKEQVKNIFGEKGIRNDLDTFTLSGNRRSFWQLHDKYNLSNLVKALTNKETKASQNSFLTGFGKINAQMSKQFESIEDIKNNESRLIKDVDNENLESYREIIGDDVGELANYYKYANESFNMQGFENASESIFDLAKSGNLEESNFRKILKENIMDAEKVPSDLINKIITDLNNLKELGTDYFEAKPQRAVSFDEVKAVVVPNNIDSKLKQQLLDRGMNVIEYDPEIEGDREAKISSLDQYKFSKQSNGKFGEWVDKNTNNTGTQTKVSDVLLPENIRNIKDEIREKINTTGDLDTELKKDLRKLVDNTNDEKQLKKYLDDINELNETSNSKEKTFVPIKGTIKINNYKNAKINQKIVDTALDMVKPNKQGNRTKDQWLQVAEQIGLNAPPDKIDVYANKTWLDLRPYESLNKQGKRSVYFKKDDWINAVNKGAETTIANIDSTEVQNINKVLENKDIVNDAKDNETLLNEITGKVTLEDYLTHDPNYYDGEQFDFDAHRTEIIEKANKEIYYILKDSKNIREDLQRAYDLNEQSEGNHNYLKTGLDEDNRLMYQHKEELLSSLLRTKDIKNNPTYKNLMASYTIATDYLNFRKLVKKVKENKITETEFDRLSNYKEMKQKLIDMGRTEEQAQNTLIELGHIDDNRLNAKFINDIIEVESGIDESQKQEIRAKIKARNHEANIKATQNNNEKFAKVPIASMDKQIENMKAKSDEKAQQLLRGVDVSIKRGTKNSIVVSNDNSVAVSKHGNLYFYGTKPTAKDYIKTGLDATLEKGTLRLVPKEANNVDAGLRTEEWTGEKWEDYYEVSNKRSQQWAKEAFEDSNESNESPTLQFIKDARNQDKATVKQVIDAYMQKIVNSGHYIDQLADKVNNPELKYANDKRLSTYGEAQYSIGVAQTDINGNEIGKSLIDIFKPVEQAGLKNEFNDYLLNRLNIERQAVEKAIFGDEITSQKSRKIIRDYEEAHPEFKEWAQDVYTFNRNELQNLVDAGLVSKDTQELFRKMYGDYVPVHRILEEVYEKGNKTTKETGVSNPIKRAKGGYQEILDIETAMAENVLSSKKAIRMNELGKQLAISLGHKNILEDMGYEPKWTPDAIMSLNGDVVINEDGKYLYTIYTNGEMKQFALTKELYEGLRKDTIQNKINNSKIAKRILDPFEKATKLQRDVLTTYSVGFLLNNPIKDFQDGLFYTKYSAGQFLKNYSVALKEIATKGKYYKQYMALGGQDNSFFEYGKGIKQEAKGLKKVLAKIEQMNSVLETAPRLAEFISSIENGASVNEAMYNASDITTNFKRGGEYTKLANKYGMNFLNASVQGFDKFMRTMKVTDTKSAFRLVARVASMGILPALLNGFMYKDDDDYEKLEDYIKDEYYLIKLNDDGDFLRIPKGRVLATISSATRTVIEGAQGDLDLKSFKDEAIKQLAPGNPLENNIVAPLIQAYNNKTWYKTDLVPKRLQNQLPKYQYNEKTDKISMWLGENLNISPIKINYLIDQYSGGFGDLILPMLTPQAENNILTDKFTTSAVMKNKTVGEFYDALDKYEKLKNSPNATEEETTKYAYLSKVSSKVGKLYAQKRDIQMDSTLSDKEKKELVKDVQREINAYTECAMDLLNGEYNENTKWNMYTEGIISDKVRESDGNSALQDALYIVNNGIATKGEYMEMYQLAKDNNVSIPTMNKLVEMKNNNVKLTTYTDFMIGTKEFKADRDEDDKAIAGTLNAKKATYIMDMDATKEQKNGLLNMLSEGASYDDLKKLKGNYTMYFKQSGKRPTSGGLSAREKYMSFINAGISPDQLDAYYTGISQIKGSNKKQAVFNFINSLKLTIPQKMMLLAKQYKNFRKLYVKDIVAYIKGLKVSKQEKIKMIYSIFYS